MGLQVEEGAVHYFICPPITTDHGEDACGLYDDNGSVNYSCFENWVSSFCCERATLCDLVDECFDGGWRGPWGGNLYEICCNYVVVDVSVGSSKVSKDLESRGISKPKRGVLEQLDVDVGNSYEEEAFKVVIYLVVEVIVLS